ncbi:MAG: cytochrome c biogenesis protein ResB [Kiritimatiellae bacterium]|nr:cytochrome c biogenesis protein ResB [Kiritimatiellia bacterium]MDD5521972.1 cytochrome c biogenesis protein ResB [Kiritimatiellia bacterium]
MITGFIIFVLLVFFMLSGVFPVQGGMQVVIFHTPFFILLMASLVVSSLLCCWKKRGLTLRKIGFQLTHLGIVVILAGAFTGFLTAKKSEFALPISGSHEIKQIPTGDGNSSYDLNFGIAVTNFQVDFYEQTDKQSSPTPKHFQASLRINTANSSTLSHELAVNHPVEHAGWRFYLMSYDTESRRYVVLSARQDPGRNIVFAGIAMLMIGTTIMCFRKNEDNNVTV